ncbi:MAG: hypothetical protein R2867_35250 [Caldilineaceae bacterium]
MRLTLIDPLEQGLVELAHVEKEVLDARTSRLVLPVIFERGFFSSSAS